MIDLLTILAIVGAALAFARAAWEHGYRRGAGDYEHHLKYPVTESHRHYPAGPWDQYRP